MPWYIIFYSENDPALLCRYLDFLSTWAQVSEDLDSLALDVANLVVERNGLVCLMMNKFASCFDPLFDIFFTFMKKVSLLLILLFRLSFKLSSTYNEMTTFI